MTPANAVRNVIIDGHRYTLCKWCDKEVQYMYSKAGNKYLAQVVTLRYEHGGKVIYPAHRCEATQEQIDSILQRDADALAGGQIVKGQTIEVVKGRKAPIGTTGVVFWVADLPDQWEVTKVGFVDADGNKHFINIKNVKVKETL
jgi:hypothetical protein